MLVADRTGSTSFLSKAVTVGSTCLFFFFFFLIDSDSEGSEQTLLSREINSVRGFEGGVRVTEMLLQCCSACWALIIWLLGDANSED